MLRPGLVLLFISCVRLELQTMQYHVRISRKLRSSAPRHIGYLYSEVDVSPATYTDFISAALPVAAPLVSYRESHRDIRSDQSKQPVDARLMNGNVGTSRISETVASSPTNSIPFVGTDHPEAAKYTATSMEAAQSDIDHPISGYPYQYHKTKSDLMYERLKSVMHYQPPENSLSDFSLESYSDFHMDDDDLRTSSRSPQNNWPYFYHSPFEHEHKRAKSGSQKPKDKRYAIDMENKVIPVHEHDEDDANNVPYQRFRPYVESSDHPYSRNRPFYSYALNDYSDPKNDEDSLSFNWETDYDYVDTDNHVNDDYGKRNRRLPSDYTEYPDVSNVHASHEHGALAETVTESGYNKKHAFDNHVRGDTLNSNDKKAYEQAGNNQNAFKHFEDTFANKFGAEDHKKNEHYSLKKNQDKGEKRKGFRRVYHKDEYSEDNEFYDNSNQSAKVQEEGASSAHGGGSQAALSSHAVAATGNQANAYQNAGNNRRSKFKKNHKGHDGSNGSNIEFNRYRDVTKLH